MGNDSWIVLPDAPLRPVVAADHDRRVPPTPGRAQELAGRIAALVGDLRELPEVAFQLGDTDLTEMMGVLLGVRAAAESAATLVASDAEQRGSVLCSDAATTTQWVADAALDAGVPLDVRDAHTIAEVARGCTRFDHHVMRDAISRGAATVTAARCAMTQAAKVMPSLPSADHDEILGWYLALDPALGVRGQRQLTRRILATYNPDRIDRDDGALERTQTLSWATLENGLTRLVAELAPVNAAIVKDAITAHSAPRPATADADADADTPPGDRAAAAHRNSATTRDTRTPGERRVDGLITLIHAGARLTEHDATQVGSGSRVVVTIPIGTLLDGIGAATTLTGDVLDPGTARRLACDADVVPAVLGTESQPLDVGRSKRLVTPALRAAVILRDGCCTFPGCDRPPQYCETHHITHWARGGPTSLANSALLCTTHHQTVHRHDYTAATTPAGVTWDLTPHSAVACSGAA